MQVLDDIENLTDIVMTDEIQQLQGDLSKLRTMPCQELADDGQYTRTEEPGRVVENFKLNGRVVERLKYSEIEIRRKVGSKGEEAAKYACAPGKKLEKLVDAKIGKGPSLEVEQRVAASILCEKDGILGGKKDMYWAIARNLAQKSLYLDEALEVTTQTDIAAGTMKDDKFMGMLAKVEKNLKKAKNPYHQAKRDEYAASISEIIHSVKDADIIVVLDKTNNVVVSVLSGAFSTLLPGIQDRVTEAFEKWTYLMPLPLPDKTRHGLHWVKHLVENPQFDYRKAAEYPRAVSGVAHYGIRCAIGDSTGKNVVRTQDTKLRNVVSDHSEAQSYKLRFGALGACTQVVGFPFKALDPGLFDKYVEVCRNSNPHIRWDTTRHGEFATLRALLTNVQTDDHKDKSDWRFGLAGLTCLGNFEGGDLFFRDLALKMEFKSGSVSLMRGRELNHSTTAWKGEPRFCVVHAVHEPVRKAAYRNMGQTIPTEGGDSDVDSCIDAQLYDSPIEEGIDTSDLAIHPEHWQDYETDSSIGDSEASDKETESGIRGRSVETATLRSDQKRKRSPSADTGKDGKSARA